MGFIGQVAQKFLNPACYRGFMLLLSAALKHYKRPEIQKAIVEHAKNKEVAVKFTDKFGKRPDTLSHPGDVFELAKQGATSFHSSEEIWKNPLQLDTSSDRKQLDSLRTGWDLVLDIDCAVLEYSKIAADLIIKALRHYKIGCVSCKFSGNKGFHIGVPFEAFPEVVGSKRTSSLFPEGARAIADYLREMIKEPLSSRVIKFEKGNIDEIARKTGKKKETILKSFRGPGGVMMQSLEVESFLVIDTILISSRHLYRMPYSLHEKSLHVSIPIDPDNVLSFEKASAKPENVVVSGGFKFLDRSLVKRGEASQLLVQALDSHHKAVEQKIAGNSRKIEEYEVPEEAIPEQYFPPCITSGLMGMRDGRKRFVFVMLNFLRSCGWEYDRIEQLLKEWNLKNEEALRETYIVAPLRYHKAKHQKVLPPNCKAMEYYVDMGICKPDNLCKMIKNPVQYSKRKIKYINEEAKKERAKSRGKAKPAKKKETISEVEYEDSR